MLLADAVRSIRKRETGEEARDHRQENSFRAGYLDIVVVIIEKINVDLREGGGNVGKLDID